MAFKHGKDVFVSLNAVDLSAFTNNTDLGREADEHDVTTYGKSAHVYSGGLLDGEITIGGIYDDGASSPEATIEPLLGTVVPFVYRPEGTGSGKPERSGQVLVKKYDESAPVADMIKWTCTLRLSDTLTKTTQA